MFYEKNSVFGLSILSSTLLMPMFLPPRRWSVRLVKWAAVSVSACVERESQCPDLKAPPVSVLLV